MNQEDINKIIELAEGASAKVTDKDLKELTYKTVLTQLLQQSAPTPQVASGFVGGAAAPGAASVASKSNVPADKIAAWLGTSPEILSEVFEFGEDEVTVRVAHNQLPKRIADAQRLLAHLKLAADKIGYDKDEVTAQAMIQMFDDHGCKDGNAAKNLKASNYVIQSGSKGTMKSYKMRYSGLSAMQQEVKNVLGITA